MEIAIIGSGISGLTSAYLLSKAGHKVTVFEKNAVVGGHTATIDVDYCGEKHAIDTGFIVFNDRTYPNFLSLLHKLGVRYKKSSMGFSVSNQNTGLEYAGKNLDTIFAQRRNLLSPSFWMLLKEIVRFNRIAARDVDAGRVQANLSLADYLAENKFSETFCLNYLIPMGAAIWSATYQQVGAFSALFFLRFFLNHGLLDITNRPQWFVIENGSRSYIPALSEAYKDNIRLSTSISAIKRSATSVDIHFTDAETETYDHVVIATHSDQALGLLDDASQAEKDILSAIPYQENSVILHSDESLLPKRKKTWSSWNYLASDDASAMPTLTYNMNILQGLHSDTTFCVSLNAEARIDSKKIIGKYAYAHPQFSVESFAAQKRKAEICGHNRSSFCGAYWANGFHEDGVSSAMDAVSRIDARACL